MRGSRNPFWELAPVLPEHTISEAHLHLTAPTPLRDLSGPPTLLKNSFNMQVPPYLELMDLDAMWQGQEPIFRLKLTHLGDGSSILASSLPHGIADGSRHATLLADLATAYCGEQVRLRLHQQGGQDRPSC